MFDGYKARRRYHERAGDHSTSSPQFRPKSSIRNGFSFNLLHLFFKARTEKNGNKLKQIEQLLEEQKKKVFLFSSITWAFQSNELEQEHEMVYKFCAEAAVFLQQKTRKAIADPFKLVIQNLIAKEVYRFFCYLVCIRKNIVKKPVIQTCFTIYRRYWFNMRIK